MEEKYKKFMIGGIIFTILTGTLLHFVYSWSGENQLVGIFGSKNESTWEHLKLLFWPMFIYGMLGYFLMKNKNDHYFQALLHGISVGLIAIVAIFYTYSGILGTNYLLLDILTFIIAVIWAFYRMYMDLTEPSQADWSTMKSNEYIAKLGLLVLVAAFVIFSFYPPDLGLFYAPME